MKRLRWGVLRGKHQVLWRFAEAFAEYVAHVGTPRVVRCDVDLDGYQWVYKCRSHEIGWSERIVSLSGQTMDRCPVAGLEEWRAKRWEAAA